MKVSNAGQIRAQVDAPNPDTRLFLFHGPDEAAADELVSRLARALGPDSEKIDFEIKQLRSNPGLLADEAAAISMFGGKRLIRVRGADDSLAEAFNLLLGAEQAGNPVVAVGPGLKTSSKVVKLAIAAPNAVAHACYVPEGPAASQLAATIAREHGLRLANDVAQELASGCNADRAILTREIEKLALFLDAAPDRPRDADMAALDAIGADLGEAEMSHLIDAILDGRAGDIGGELERLAESGASAIPLMRALTRRLMALAELRVEIDGGMPADQALQKIFFRERPAFTRALRRWSAANIARAVDRVRAAERAIMRSGNAGDVLAEAECTALARAAARFGR